MSDHTPGAIASALSLAPMGARCMAEGFTDFRATPYGWQQAETGWLVSTGLLSEMIAESVPKSQDSPTMTGASE